MAAPLSPSAAEPDRSGSDLRVCTLDDHVGSGQRDDDAIDLAARLRAAGLPGVALIRRDGVDYVTALPRERSTALHPPTSELCRGPGAEAPRWIGVLPYEAARGAWERAVWVGAETRSPPWLAARTWRRYPSVLRVDVGRGRGRDARRGRVTLITEDPVHAETLRAALRGGARATRNDIRVQPTDPPAAHRARVAAAIERILDGDLYQVNLARRLRVTGVFDPLALFRALRRTAPSPYGAVFATGSGWVVSTSPERCLRIERHPGGRRRLVTEPIKGTRPRGDTGEADRRLAADLDADPKERAELAMIVDVARNDLGAVAETGTVTLSRRPHVWARGPVWHRSAEVQAWARSDLNDDALVAANLPSGSVTGAPKVRAMEIIADLEASRRGLYTGAFGTLAHDGTLELTMAIRTVTLRPEDGLAGRTNAFVGSYFTGGGIVAASDPERELAETGWKALQLTRAAGGG
ncbi:MAG: anthranilate synthase component I family protein [Myxococcota bacterium]